MANQRLPLWINRRWLLFMIACIAFSPLVCPNLCFAAFLKDIRIGEYGEFTRIVFEMDTLAADSVSVDQDSPEKVGVIFNQTEPELARKIPIERSPNIKGLRIVSEKNRLHANLQLALPYKKVTTFQLNEPPRMVVDIYWGEPNLVAVTTGGDSSPVEKTEVPAADEKADPESKTPEMTALANETSVATPQITVATTQSVTPEAPPATTTPQETEVAATSPTLQDVTHPSTPETEQENQQAPDASPPGKSSGWLQYYLVIALVIITIVILSLLVLMLISKYRWPEDGATLNASEYLKRQDQRLASLDERIKEQLRRYDDA